MSTLHIIRASAFSNNTVKNSIALLKGTDKILLIDDGVYNLNHAVLGEMTHLISKQQLFVIGAHIQARGVKCSATESELFTNITIDDVVELSLSVSQNITWQ